MTFDKILPDTEHIRYVNTNLAFLSDNPIHFKCGLYLICISGECEVSTGAQTFILKNQTELIFLTGTLLQRGKASEDFSARLLMFPKDLFLKAMLPIDTPYFNYAYEHPYYCHTADRRSQQSWNQLCLWMDVAEMLFTGYESQFMEQQEYCYLQGVLMWLFNTVPEKQEVNPEFSRCQRLCRKFMQMIRENGAKEHSSAFYADELCVSPRYLHKATTLYLNGKTPKELIDEQLVAEIKVLLNDKDLTVTDIAEQLNFADQSYLSRFFKRHTGLSPNQYRGASV